MLYTVTILYLSIFYVFIISNFQKEGYSNSEYLGEFFAKAGFREFYKLMIIGKE